jgi:hypothetical protein
MSELPTKKLESAGVLLKNFQKVRKIRKGREGRNY